MVKTLADMPVMSHSANTDELNNYLNYSILVIVPILVIITIITKIVGRTIIVLTITIITGNIYIALVLCSTIACTLQL